ncbi:MAG: transposase family protein [Paludibacteraceae bacterium]
MKSPMSYFSSLPDPRLDRTKEHLLEDIIFITIAAVVCGAESWNDIENYGKSKVDWLRPYLQLPGGIPSYDTFNRFFSALEPSFLTSTLLSSKFCNYLNANILQISGHRFGCPG